MSEQNTAHGDPMPDYLSEPHSFDDEAMTFAAEWPALGPHYHEGRKAVEVFMEKFDAEHFKPLIEKMASEFQDKLWSDLETYLLSDVESNLHGSMRRMVEGAVRALLTGEEWALKYYPLSGYHDGQKIREAVLRHCRDQITDMRVAELETEVAKLKQDLAWERRR